MNINYQANLMTLQVLDQFTQLNMMILEADDTGAIAESHNDKLWLHLYVIGNEYTIVWKGYEWRGSWSQIQDIAWKIFR